MAHRPMWHELGGNSSILLAPSKDLHEGMEGISALLFINEEPGARCLCSDADGMCNKLACSLRQEPCKEAG